MTLRNPRRVVLALAIVQLLVASTVLGYRWVTTTTEASVDTALERYREQEEPPDMRFEEPPEADDEAESPDADGASEVAPEGGSSESQAEAGGASAGVVFDEAPAGGVYRWATDGSEQVGGLSRDFPERSVRLVTREGSRTWTNEHRYSEEHVQEFTMVVNGQGVSTPRYRSRVSFGPFTEDRTIVFDPPMRVGIFPMEAGQRWEGSFTGPTSGTYSGHTFERTTLRIGDEDLEVFGIQVDLEMEGEVNATVVTKVWVSPEYRMPVKEIHDQRARSGGVTYTGRWTITLLSTRPER